MKGLTRRQRETLDFIVWYLGERDYPPSVREIAEGTGVTSSATAFTHLQALVTKGYIQNDGGPRMLRIVEKAL